MQKKGQFLKTHKKDFRIAHIAYNKLLIFLKFKNKYIFFSVERKTMLYLILKIKYAFM